MHFGAVCSILELRVTLMLSIRILAAGLALAISGFACSSPDHNANAARDSAAAVATAERARADSLHVAQDSLPPGRLRIKVTEDVPHRKRAGER